jgi:two-component system cell cycle sensor histidine kinase/response regulator CckA
MAIRNAPAWLWAALGLFASQIWIDRAFPLASYPGRKLADYCILECFCIMGFGVFAAACRRSDVPRHARGILRMTRMALLFQALGGASLIALQAARTRTPQGPLGSAELAISLVFFAASDGVLILGMVYMPRAQGIVRGTARSAIDALTFLVGTGVPYWLFSIRPLLGSPSLMEDLFTVLFPLLSFAGLLTLSWALETRAAQPSRAAVRMLLAGAALLWISDIIISIGQASGLQRSVLIDMVNLINSFAVCLWLVAGWCFSVDPYNDKNRKPLVEFSPLPLITIVAEVGFVVLLVLFREPDPHIYPKLLVSFLLFLGILLAREVFVIRDSLRLVAAEAGQTSRARFEVLVRQSSDAVLVADDKRVVRFASFASLGVLGVAPEAIVGSDLLLMVHPDDRSEVSSFFDRLILNPSVTDAVQWRLVSPDGAVRHLETAGSNLLKEPEIEGVVLNTRDVSERTRLEDQLHRVARMEAVGRLAGSVAHDFNNLLAVVLTNADLAASELEDRNTPPSDPVSQDIDEIRKAAARGATLTKRLLAFSRTEVVRPRAVPVADLITDAVVMLQSTVGPTVKLLTEVAPDCGAVKVNPDDFVQALINLGTNAKDAMPEGGTLTLTAAPARVDGRPPDAYLEVPPGRYVCVSVSDTGEGMDEATRRRAFEPFFTTKERSKGTGLGLASVFATVKTCKGGITLSSAPGQGTTVRLWMPECEAEPREEAAVAAPPVAGNATILLVEDEEALRQAMDRILRAAGFRVFLAAGADQAMGIFEANAGAIDLVLTDIIMPGKSGTKMAAEFRKKKPGQKILFISGFTGEQPEGDALGNLGFRLLRKPYNTERLVAAIRDVLLKDLL